MENVWVGGRFAAEAEAVAEPRLELGKGLKLSSCDQRIRRMHIPHKGHGQWAMCRVRELRRGPFSVRLVLRFLYSLATRNGVHLFAGGLREDRYRESVSWDSRCSCPLENSGIHL